MSDPVGEILDALQFAAQKHRDQRRKDLEASPYINHPIALATVLWREGGVHEPAVVMAALLHDTIEDTETSAAQIRKRFGAKVARIVSEVTDDKALPKAQRKRLQIEHAPHISREAKLVKLADKISGRRAGCGNTSNGRRRWWTPCAASTRSWKRSSMRLTRGNPRSSRAAT